MTYCVIIAFQAIAQKAIEQAELIRLSVADQQASGHFFFGGVANEPARADGSLTLDVVEPDGLAG